MVNIESTLRKMAFQPRGEPFIRPFPFLTSDYFAIKNTSFLKIRKDNLRGKYPRNYNNRIFNKMSQYLKKPIYYRKAF